MPHIIHLGTEVIITVFLIEFTAPLSGLGPTKLLFTTFCVFRFIIGRIPYIIRTPWAALVRGYPLIYLYHYLVSSR
jgi:hypothetical protein